MNKSFSYDSFLYGVEGRVEIQPYGVLFVPCEG